MKRNAMQRMASLALALLLVLAAAVPASADASRFEDVAAHAWYRAAVEYVTQEGLFQGTSESAFSPERTMDRGMFITVLGRMAGVNPGEYDKLLYEDAPRSGYFTPYAQWAAMYGIAGGTEDYRFSPGQKITRQDIAMQLYRYATVTENDVTYNPHALDKFSDRNAVAGYAETAMRWAVTHNILQGSGNKILPQKTTTRAEVAQIFYNIRGYFVHNEITMEPQVVAELPEIIHPQPTHSGNRIKDLINNTRLIPMKTGTSADETVDKVFSQIFTSGMTTYDKVKACYDYLIHHTVYGINEHPEDVIYPEGFDLEMWDGTQVFLADDVLKSGIGVCDNYAAAFMVMTRRIGLETYVNGGTIGGQGHAWNNIKINGKYYLFDAQVEDRIADNNGGEIQYMLFCQDPDPDGFNYESKYTNASLEGRFNGFQNVHMVLGGEWGGFAGPLNTVEMTAQPLFDNAGNRNGNFRFYPKVLSKIFNKYWEINREYFTLKMIKAVDSQGNEIAIDPENPSGVYVQQDRSVMDDGETYYFNQWEFHSATQTDETYFFTFQVETSWGAKITRTIDIVLPRDAPWDDGYWEPQGPDLE